MDEEQKRVFDAHIKVREILDPPIPDLKLRGKTYTEMSATVLLIAGRAAEMFFSDEMLRVFVENSATTNLLSWDAEGVFEGETTRKENDAAMQKAIEDTFAVLLDAVRGGQEGIRELNDRCQKAVRDQAKATKGITETAEWEVLASSEHFDIKTLGNMMDDDRAKPQKDKNPLGYL